MKPLFKLAFLLICFSTISYGQDVERVWESVLENNPQILAAKSAWQVSKQGIIYQGGFPDPKLKFSYLNLPTKTLDLNRTPMSGKQLMITQGFPLWQAPIKTQLAIISQFIAWAKYKQVEIEIKEEVHKLYYSLWYNNREKTILNKNLVLYKKMVLIAKSRYEAGKGQDQDVLRAQVELTIIENRLLENQQQQQSLIAKLEAQLNSQEKPLDYSRLYIPQKRKHLNKEKMIIQLVQNNPKLEVLRQMVKLYEKKAFLEGTSWVPNLEFSGYYTWRDEIQGDPVQGEDFVGASIGLKIPIMYPLKNHARSKEAKLMEEQRVQQLLATKLNLIAELKINIDRANQLIASQQLYEKKILPQADAALSSAMAAYQTGALDFLTALNNETMLINHQLNFEKLKRDYQLTIAYLESLISTTLPVEEN